MPLTLRYSHPLTHHRLPPPTYDTRIDNGPCIVDGYDADLLHWTLPRLGLVFHSSVDYNHMYYHIHSNHIALSLPPSGEDMGREKPLGE